MHMNERLSPPESGDTHPVSATVDESRRFEHSSGFSKAYLEIDALALEDVTPMLDLFSRAIPPAQLGRSIYLAKGANRYFAFLLQHGRYQRHEQLWGVKDASGRILAAAHTRNLHGSSHLNNFAVEPALQGQGLGRRMLDYWESQARDWGAGKLTLDVADENASARRLYVQNGFRETAVTHEFKLQEPLVSCDGDDPLLHGWPQAQAHFETFGFGRFSLEWVGRVYPVDLIEGYFRVSSYEERLLSALHRMDADRVILLRDSRPRQAGPWIRTGAVIQMNKDLA